MMCSPLPLLLLALASALAAPAMYDDYTEVVPQKRAALVLDRLLIALQKALHEDAGPRGYERPDRDGPRTAPLRIADDDVNDVVRLTNTLISALYNAVAKETAVGECFDATSMP